MGKRQVRIFRKNLEQHVPELLHQPVVQVVLRSNVVVAGTLVSIAAGKLELKDFRSGRHEFGLDQVQEIIYDVEAPY